MHDPSFDLQAMQFWAGTALVLSDRVRVDVDSWEASRRVRLLPVLLPVPRSAFTKEIPLWTPRGADLASCPGQGGGGASSSSEDEFNESGLNAAGAEEVACLPPLLCATTPALYSFAGGGPEGLVPLENTCVDSFRFAWYL